MENQATVIGAGLAGCEAAWQLAQAGVEVTLVEMKPIRFSPAHHSAGFAELVCSNSLKAERLASAAGLLKAEMQVLGSLCVACAYESRVPAGGALAVDREQFSRLVTEQICAHARITVEHREATAVPKRHGYRGRAARLRRARGGDCRVMRRSAELFRRRRTNCECR